MSHFIQQWKQDKTICKFPMSYFNINRKGNNNTYKTVLKKGDFRNEN